MSQQCFAAYVRNTGSVISRNSASPNPSAKPPTVAIAKMRNDLGEFGSRRRQSRGNGARLGYGK